MRASIFSFLETGVSRWAQCEKKTQRANIIRASAERPQYVEENTSGISSGSLGSIPTHSDVAVTTGGRTANQDTGHNHMNQRFA